MRLKDKIIIVTGGSGLLGKELVKDINLRGGKAINADIAVTSDLKADKIHMDITDFNSVHKCIHQILTEFGRIDGLVNNAYPRTMDWGNKFEDITFESWQKNVDMQLNSCFVLCQQVLKQMKNQSYGSIVNIASIYGLVGNDFSLYEGYEGTSPAAYSAIKGGIINFTRYLASYYGPYNIRINCVSPGGIKDKQHHSFIEKYEHKVPLRRLATPEDIAPSVSFLLSEESKYITGQNIIVDGGWTSI